MDIVKANVAGSLAERIRRNSLRFSGEYYSMEDVRTQNAQSWPGDFRGRLLLAEACHYCIGTGDETRYKALLEDTLTAYEIVDMSGADYADEQTIAGCSWLMRGLIASAENFEDRRIMAMAETLFERVYLPMLRWLDWYPMERERKNEGEAIGEIIDTAYPHWRLSSDVGCVFISLDGLSAYYEYTMDERALDILNRLVEMFEKIDPLESRLQTHATLSGMRGLLRLYGIARKEELLRLVEERFELYRFRGMSATYTNYNWFDRPTWSEPCGIVDAFMIALRLFELTDNAEYLDIAWKTLYNGLLASQRENGGFGCDSCVRQSDEPELYVVSGLYEAYWCCSMRGAEGLTEAARKAVLCRDGEVLIAIPTEGEYETPFAALCVAGDYPLNSECFHVRVSDVRKPFRLKIAMPDGIADLGMIDRDAAFEMKASDLPVGSSGLHERRGLIVDGMGRFLSERFHLPKSQLLDTKFKVLY